MKGKWNSLFTVLGMLAFVAVYTLAWHYSLQREFKEEYTENPDLLKTVAHIDLSNRDDLELVAANYDKDVAYYKFVKPTRNIKIGETVKLLGGTEATLVYTDAVGFAISADTAIVAGMSGSAVQNMDGEQIGYISHLLADGTVYCVWS